MTVDLANDPRRQNSLNPPKMRGVMHAAASPISVIVGIIAVAMATTTTARLLLGVYALAVWTMFTASAVFHRGTWTDEGWQKMRQVDQTAIYLMIAGSYTGFAGLALTDPWRVRLLVAVWIGALLGSAMIWLPVRVPYGLNTVVYFAVGGLVALRLGELAESIGRFGVSFVVGGLLLYVLGSLALGARVPNPIPGVFGYHEVWHTLVTISVIMHYTVVFTVLIPNLK